MNCYYHSAFGQNRTLLGRRLCDDCYPVLNRQPVARRRAIDRYGQALLGRVVEADDEPVAFAQLVNSRRQFEHALVADVLARLPQQRRIVAVCAPRHRAIPGSDQAIIGIAQMNEYSVILWR